MCASSELCPTRLFSGNALKAAKGLAIPPPTKAGLCGIAVSYCVTSLGAVSVGGSGDLVSYRIRYPYSASGGAAQNSSVHIDGLCKNKRICMVTDKGVRGLGLMDASHCLPRRSWISNGHDL